MSVAPLPNTEPLRGKRVAMVLFSYYPGDPRPRRAAEALVASGARVELICLRENAADPTQEQVNGVDVRRVPMARRRGGTLGYLYQYLAFLLVSSSIISFRLRRGRYDLIYVHNMPDFLVLCGVIPKVFGARIILDLHDPMPELMQTIFGVAPEAKSVRMLRRVERWSIGLADAVVTVNRACAKLFASRSCASDKITVVMNSPDETIFRKRDSSNDGAERVGGPEGRKEAAERRRTEAIPRVGPTLRDAPRPFVVMYHGSLVERNGLAVAVDAFDKVQASIPTAELWVFGGRNAFLDRVMESVRARGLENRVRYYGSKPLEQIVDAISNCDVGIIPNQRNIFTELNTPTRIFEYLALGKPVIAPNAPGITDYFSENSLVFFELGDSDDLARKIEFVYRNPERVSEITRRGQEVHFEHTWGAEKSQLTGLVSGLLNGHHAPLTATATARIED